MKWFAVACLGTLTLLGVALVHLDNWRSQLAAMLIYASAISVGFTAAYLEAQSLSSARGQLAAYR
ncbi:MAG: hypothetical protein MZV65_47545 [Chromatiales bacterium]|nr:hypothetical protein [Chromatiales bacterium]